MNNFWIITITHKTANLSHIGKYIPTLNNQPKQLAKALEKIKQTLQINELFYLATCNRLLFFIVTEQTITDTFCINLFKQLYPNIPEHCLGAILDVSKIYHEKQAVHHLLQVASSIDSLVVGEREILGQIKSSYDFCHKHQLTADNIRLLIKLTIPAAKQVYQQTKIAQNSISVVSLAIQKMMELQPKAQSQILMVGAGQTNNLVAKQLLKLGFTKFSIFNRNLENATCLANKVNGNAYLLNQLSQYNKNFDILIVCTAATQPIITQQIYTQLIANNTSKKIIIDLAMPNNVDTQVIEQNNINYINITQLQSLAEQNLTLRKQEVEQAETIIQHNIVKIQNAFKHRKLERAMASIPEKIKEVKNHAINNVFNKEIASLNTESQATLFKVIEYIEKKYISIPMSVAGEALQQMQNNS